MAFRVRIYREAPKKDKTFFLDKDDVVQVNNEKEIGVVSQSNKGKLNFDKHKIHNIH